MSWSRFRNPSRLERLARGIWYRWWGGLLPGRPIVSPPTVLGLSFACHPRDAVGRDIFKRGIYEPGILRALDRCLTVRSGDVAVDVGANIGWYSCILGRLHEGNGRVLALEPEPENFALLCANLRRNGLDNVEPAAMAASDVEGSLQLNMFDATNRGRHSLLPIHQGRQLAVPAAPLDDLLEERGLGSAPISLLKLDVEGYEPVVLRGAGRALSRTRLVLAEWSPEFSRRGGVEPSEMLRLLDEAGLRPSVVEPGGSLRPVVPAELLGATGQENVLFRREQ